MKKILPFLLLISCQKYEMLSKAKPKNCQISSISYGIDVASFHYTGDKPTSVTFGTVKTGSPNLYFEYEKGRLSSYAGRYNDGVYEFLYKYKWDNERIISDTFRTMNGLTTAVDTYTYDNEGRIIEVNNHDIPISCYYKFKYNYEGGNLNSIQGYTNNVMTFDVILAYTTDVNISTVNPIWQFINRDYSLNSRLPASSYFNGLPSSFNYNQFEDFLYQIVLSKSEIKYSCK